MLRLWISATISCLLSSQTNGLTLPAVRLKVGHSDLPYADHYHKQCEPDAAASMKWGMYKIFHKNCRENRACIKRALVWKCDTPDDCGGLGDNIKGIAFTLYAAMASKRPFFIVWNRMGQNMLEFFSQAGINVEPPSELKLDRCQSQTMFSSKGNMRIMSALNSASYGSKCISWTTNYDATSMLEQDGVVEKFLPWMGSANKMYAMGCAMRYLFKPIQLTSEDKVQFPNIPNRFSVVHLRVSDDEFADGQQSMDRHAEEVMSALQCAKMQNASDVLFLSPSEACKVKAVDMANSLGLRVFVSKGVARHLNHKSHDKLTSSELRAALWSDFAAMNHGDLVVSSKLSGFSRSAVSMAFLPKQRYVDGRLCKPFD